MSFNWIVYKALNPDLTFNTKIEFERHYLEYGRKERRPCSIYSLYPDFNYTNYKDNYTDLNYYNKLDLEVHWILVGRKEGRTYKKILKWIYIICGIGIGGTNKYINDLVSYYKINVKFIKNRKELYTNNFLAKDIILVQQLLFTDIRPDDLIYIKNTKKPKIIITLHDFSWFNKNIYSTNDEINHTSYIKSENNVIPQVKILFRIVDNVICPSEFIYQEYTKRINSDKYIIVHHTDYKCDTNRIVVPKVINSINIGVFNNNSKIKGNEYVSYLMNNFKTIGGISINYFVVGFNVGTYKEDEFFKLLSIYNIHGLLLLNKYAESWCYLLTKYLFSGLPILYNNIGSFRERIKPLENHFSVGEKDVVIDINNLNKGFEDMLNYIITNGKLGKHLWTDGAELNKPDFYVELFKDTV
jgi:hypothetical protein